MIGKCFYYDGFQTVSHLFVVLCPSLEDPDTYICVNLTTKREGSDPTCEIRADEHPSLTSPISVAYYALAKEFPAALIERLSLGISDMRSDVLARIQKSPLTDESRLKIRYKKALLAYLNASPR